MSLEAIKKKAAKIDKIIGVQTASDIVVEVAFEPIKQQLKRDLVKWDEIREKRSEAGKKSAQAKKNKLQQNQQVLTSVKSVEQTSTKSTVNDTVNVTVNDNVINNISPTKSLGYFCFML